MRKAVLICLCLWFQVVALAAQDFQEASNDPFHSAILQAAHNRIAAATAGPERIKARNDYWKVRRSMLLPKVREYAKEMVLTQIRIEVANGADNAAVPVVDGKVQVEGIDWTALIAFLEKLIPLIIALIGLFGWACYNRFFYLVFTKGSE